VFFAFILFILSILSILLDLFVLTGSRLLSQELGKRVRQRPFGSLA